LDGNRQIRAEKAALFSGFGKGRKILALESSKSVEFFSFSGMQKDLSITI
jgi:hypothetical protein